MPFASAAAVPVWPVRRPEAAYAVAVPASGPALTAVAAPAVALNADAVGFAGAALGFVHSTAPRSAA